MYCYVKAIIHILTLFESYQVYKSKFKPDVIYMSTCVRTYVMLKKFEVQADVRSNGNAPV